MIRQQYHADTATCVALYFATHLHNDQADPLLKYMANGCEIYGLQSGHDECIVLQHFQKENGSIVCICKDFSIIFFAVHIDGIGCHCRNRFTCSVSYVQILLILFFFCPLLLFISHIHFLYSLFNSGSCNSLTYIPYL